MGKQQTLNTLKDYIAQILYFLIIVLPILLFVFFGALVFWAGYYFGCGK